MLNNNVISAKIWVTINEIERTKKRVKVVVQKLHDTLSVKKKSAKSD